MNNNSCALRYQPVGPLLRRGRRRAVRSTKHRRAADAGPPCTEHARNEWAAGQPRRRKGSPPDLSDAQNATVRTPNRGGWDGYVIKGRLSADSQHMQHVPHAACALQKHFAHSEHRELGYDSAMFVQNRLVTGPAASNLWCTRVATTAPARQAAAGDQGEVNMPRSLSGMLAPWRLEGADVEDSSANTSALLEEVPRR